MKTNDDGIEGLINPSSPHKRYTYHVCSPSVCMFEVRTCGADRTCRSMYSTTSVGGRSVLVHVVGRWQNKHCSNAQSCSILQVRVQEPSARECLWQPAAPVVLQPSLHDEPVIVGCVHLPPRKIGRKLLRVILGYLLCMGTSLMLIHWAFAQLPSPATISQAEATQPAEPAEAMAGWALPRCLPNMPQPCIIPTQRNQRD